MNALRPYQQQAIAAVLEAWGAGWQAPLLVMSTGLGKTVCFAKLAEAVRPVGRTLVLAHREELIAQACEKIAAWTPLSTAVEMADARADGALLPADVVVASVASLARRLARYPRDTFALVIVDECHHAPASSYRTILEHFAGAKRLGLTATPDRLDGLALGGLFDCAPFTMELRDAIEQGWLVRIRQRAVQVHGLDFSQVRTTAGDLNEGDLERILVEEDALHRIAEPIVRHAEGRPTLVFATTVAHADALAIVLGRYAGADVVAALSGQTDRATRRATLEAFRAGRLRYLVNVALFSEGFDEPAVACIAMARPTKSRALYTQQIGRGTRLHPGKTDLLVLDFVGNAGRHQLISALDVLDGPQDAAVKARAQRLMARDPQLDILGALGRASQELGEEARTAALEAARLREATRQRIVARAETSLTEIDPFTMLGIRPRAGRWGGVAMTEPQRAALLKAGIPAGELDRGQASEVLDALAARREAGRCTLKQARLLARFGVSPDVSFEEAGKAITAIKAAGWRVPRWVRERHGESATVADRAPAEVSA
jgi:superfamily II DNA or RNA helicase